METRIGQRDDFDQGASTRFPSRERMPKTARRNKAARQLIRMTTGASGFRSRAAVETNEKGLMRILQLSRAPCGLSRRVEAFGKLQKPSRSPTPMKKIILYSLFLSCLPVLAETPAPTPTTSSTGNAPAQSAEKNRALEIRDLLVSTYKSGDANQ